MDDLLDYEGSSAEMGKNAGDDLREGKPTLPLLIAMTRCNEAQREFIREAIRNGEEDRLSEVLGIVRATGALDATREAAMDEARRAQALLERLPESIYREALIELCSRSVHRSH